MVVKNPERWLKPTTSDQCGQNHVHRLHIHIHTQCTSCNMCTCRVATKHTHTHCQVPTEIIMSLTTFPYLVIPNLSQLRLNLGRDNSNSKCIHKGTVMHYCSNVLLIPGSKMASLSEKASKKTLCESSSSSSSPGCCS